jgi:hypothetical protein
MSEENIKHLVFTEDSEAKKYKGMWTSEVCAYTDPSAGVVLAASPKGESAKHGYKLYLSFRDNKADLQVGAVLPDVDEKIKHIRHRDVPEEVVNAALNAALGVVALWDSQQNNA